MRIRGVKAELEEAGLETEGMAESTAKLRAQVKALTNIDGKGGIDILADEDTFKSTYAIILEISKVWKNISDIDQAALLELLSGKRQGNIIAAALTNMTDGVNAYEASLNSLGSAEAEHEKWMESIEAKQKKFQAQYQVFSTAFLNSDLVGAVYDIGTGLLSILTPLAKINALLPLIAASMALIHYYNLAKQASEGAAAAASLVARLIAEKTVTDGMVVTYQTLNAQQKLNIVNKLEEAVATGALTAAEYADIRAKLGLAAATTGAKVATDGLNVSIKSLLMSNPVGWIITAISLLPMLINLFGSLHKSNDELIQDAEDLKSAYSSDSSKVTEDVATLEGLKDEYEELSKGVDDYGNNISLAADDYERYQDIVSTILGISPSLISGYYNEGQAIANKNGLLQQSIDLMKEEQRLKMQELVSDDSLKTIGTGAVAQIEEYEKANPLPYGDAKWDFIWAFQDAAERYANSVQGNYEGQIYDALNPDNIDLDDFWTEGYWNEYGEHAENFASDYYETIVEALRSNSSVLSNYFTEEEIDNMLKIADSYDENLKLYNSKIANLSKALNPTLQYVPQTLTAYNELSDAEKQFLTGYINTFTITADTTEKDIIKMKQDILDFTDFIANNETLREQIQIGVNLQLGKDKNGKVLSVKEYREQISQFLNNIGSFGAQTQGILKAVFGIDENGAYESDIEKAIEHAKNLLADEYDGLVDDLSVEDVMQISYSISADPNSLSYEELMAMLHEVQEKSARAVKSYETLRSATNAAVMAQSVQRDTFADNTYITEDAYNALVELAGGETQLSGCIDTANGYFVTNAKLLSDVIDASNEALVSNIKLAESHEKSNYHSLVKELASVCNGLEDYDEANLDVIESIFDQIDATKLQIAKFALLEQQVLGVTNAFEALDKAQELDEASDYTDELSGMISSLFTSYENNEFGTESFWTAFEALVPEDIYSQFTDAGDQIEAGWDYINGKLARYYTSDGSSLSIGFENIKSFVSDGLSTAFGDSTVFTGSLEDFKLNDQITSVEELADAMGVTTTTAFALANAISKYSADNEDFLSSLSVDSLEGKIYDVDQKLADLLEKQTELGKNGDIGTDEWNELQSEISSAKAELVELQDAARENVHANIEIDSEIEAQQKVVDGLHDDLMELDETDPSYSVTMENYTEASDELSQLLSKKYGLEEPTEMTIQVALESVQSDIDSVTSQLSEIAEYDAEADVWVAINESDQTKVDELMLKLQTLNDEYSTIEVYAGIDDEDVLSSLEAIQDYVIDDKEFTVSMDGYGTTKQRLETVTGLLNGIKSKTVYVTTYTKTAAQNYAGTANASGSWGTKEDEKNSLVGELGTELLVNPKTGMYETVGEHGAEIVDIPKGSIIFNHKQTEQLLKYRRINNRGKAYLNGNAHFSLVDKVYSKPGSDDSNSNNTSTVVVDATDLEESLKDTLDKLSEEFDEIIGNFEHSIFMMEKNGGTTEDMIATYQSMQNAAHTQADKYRQMGLDENSDYIQALQKQWWDYQDKINELEHGVYEKYLSDTEHALSLLDNQFESAASSLNLPDMRSSLNEQMAYYKEIMETAHAEAERLRAKGVDENDEMIQELQNTWWDAYNNSKDILTKIGEDIRDSFSDALDDVQSAYSTLTDAADEFAETGFITVDTFQSILSLGTEYLAYLVDENGMLTVNKEAIEAMIAAKVDDLAVTQALTLIDTIKQYKDDADALNALAFATNTATTSTWGLVYAELALLGLDENLYTAFLNQINAIRSMADTAKQSIGQDVEAIRESHEETKDALDTILDLTKDLIKWETQNQIDALNDQIDAYSKIIELKKKSLSTSKEEDDYEKNVADKVKKIAEIQAKMTQLDRDDSREANAEKTSLAKELSELQSELADYQADYSYNAQVDALDNELSAYEDEKNAEIDILEDSISSEEKIYRAAIERINSDWDGLYQDIINYNYAAGNTIESEIVSAWNLASAAVQQYGSYAAAAAAAAAQISGGSSGGAISPTGSYGTGDAASILQQMKSNSIAWYTADAAGRATLEQNQQGLADQWYAATGDKLTKKNGTWYRANGEALYTASDIAQPAIQAIVAVMKANSGAWNSASESGRTQLSNKNKELASYVQGLSGQSVTIDNAGVWWIGNRKLYETYHTGLDKGYVGASGKADEILAILRKGELVLTKEQALNIYNTLAGNGVVDNIVRSLSTNGIGETERVIKSATTNTNTDTTDVEITMPVQIYVSERLDESDIEELAPKIGKVAVKYIEDGMTRKGTNVNINII